MEKAKGTLNTFFETPIEFLKGVGPARATLLQKALGIFTFGDFIQYYPFRYDDRTRFCTIAEAHENLPYLQLKGKITHLVVEGDGFKKRLKAFFSDGTGSIELVWFQGVQWLADKLKKNTEYVVFGKPALFHGTLNIAHPEMDVPTERILQGSLQPVYSLSETLRRRHIDSRFIGQAQQELYRQALPHIHETLPQSLLQKYKLLPKSEAIKHIHTPLDGAHLQHAQRTLKFEEFFYVQWRLLKLKLLREEKFKGFVFNNAGLASEFYKKHLPFDLTNAQKKVIKEIYADMRSGKQMNRLLQGDVGSGKTIAAFICMLLAVSSEAQAVLMAPTEILAQQHYATLKKHADKLNLEVALLTGSVKKKERKPILKSLEEGTLKIVVGTHVLIEDQVQFHNLGLAVIDEQHRFGVAQRSKLWQKNELFYPHVLVMTATPIPRTLAMTLYGDLDVSVIDEMPKGRKPVKTTHCFDANRLQVFGFMKQQLSEGRQIYIVYPLIEESEKIDLNHLMDGYESISRAFPDVPLSILHGQMKPEAKEFEMKRFVAGETKIMVATTVIEVGVDVPNASVMAIENAERFGLSQLHQLRGRVGRGAEQSYCILITDAKLSPDARTRMETMCRTSNGFEISEADLQLRGAGDLTGTQQSGAVNLKIGDLSKDGAILEAARESAREILQTDPQLQQSENFPIRRQTESMEATTVNWSRIS